MNRMNDGRDGKGGEVKQSKPRKFSKKKQRLIDALTKAAEAHDDLAAALKNDGWEFSAWKAEIRATELRSQAERVASKT